MPLVLCGMVAQWRGRRPSKSRWSAEAPFSNINSRRETAPTDAARCTAEEPSEVWGGGRGEGGIEGGREGREREGGRERRRERRGGSLLVKEFLHRQARVALTSLFRFAPPLISASAQDRCTPCEWMLLGGERYECQIGIQMLIMTGASSHQYMSGVLPSWSRMSTSCPWARRLCTRRKLPHLTTEQE